MSLKVEPFQHTLGIPSIKIHQICMSNPEHKSRETKEPQVPICHGLYS